jgi:hypothetical protein
LINSAEPPAQPYKHPPIYNQYKPKNQILFFLKRGIKKKSLRKIHKKKDHKKPKELTNLQFKQKQTYHQSAGGYLSPSHSDASPIHHTLGKFIFLSVW